VAEDKERPRPVEPRKYKLEYTTSALRELKALESTIQKRVSERMLTLASDPYPSGARKMQGLENHFRIRVGDYRIIYRIEIGRVVVVIVRIGHRRDVYR
jgi:mRNA interferase RelE/StbE